MDSEAPKPGRFELFGSTCMWDHASFSVGTAIVEKRVLNLGMVRIALANLRFPVTADESISLAVGAITQAALAGAQIVCFPEEYVPGYRLGQIT